MLLDLARGVWVPGFLGSSLVQTNVNGCPCLALGNLSETSQRGSWT